MVVSANVDRFIHTWDAILMPQAAISSGLEIALTRVTVTADRWLIWRTVMRLTPIALGCYICNPFRIELVEVKYASLHPGRGVANISLTAPCEMWTGARAFDFGVVSIKISDIKIACFLVV